MKSRSGDFHTVVVGAGQCRLAIARELMLAHDDFVVLEAGAGPGSTWRSHWDSLELFTPASHDALPGLEFPSRSGAFPTAVAFADHLEEFAQHFALPVESGITVDGLRHHPDGGFETMTSAGTLTSARVVVATGAHRLPRLPAFSQEVSEHTVQIHSGAYRNPHMIAEGPVAVVGFVTSGAQIAIELAAAHTVTLCGTPTPHVPEAALRYAPWLYWFFAHRVLTRATPLGRKVAGKINGHGSPLIKVSANDVQASGIRTAARIRGVRDGMLETQDGVAVEAKTIIWATGFDVDYSWIEDLQVDADGHPLHQRGVSSQFDGLGFLGIPFQYGLTSGIIGGAGRDAHHLAAHMP